MAETTNLPSVEIDVDGFPIVGSSSIITPPQASIFKRDTEDALAFTNPGVTPETIETPEGTIEPKTTSTAEQQLDALNAIIAQETAEPLQETPPVLTGKKTDKSAMVEYLKAKIEAKEFEAFTDYDEKVPLEEYLNSLPNKDLSLLADENLKTKEAKLKEEVPRQFYDMLPGDFKLAYEYIQNGGQDLKGLYRALGEVREIHELDPKNEDHQESIVSEYLQNANPDWTNEEIKEQVSEWKDLGTIAKKAEQLKPKLDKIKEQGIQLQLQEQAEFARQRQEAANAYVKNVTEALRPADLNGIKIDSKTQFGLYNGLVNASYKSISGGNTNELGHLLEKFQYQEPNYAKIAKVLWILKDEEGYENALIQKGKNINTEETVRKLKTEQGNRGGSFTSDVSGDASRTQRSISRTPLNPFKK